MADLADKLSEELDRMRALRDDLRVRLHLGKAEIRDRWEKVEKDWEHLDLSVTYGDLRRHGPGLLLDHTAASGARVMLWATER